MRSNQDGCAAVVDGGCDGDVRRALLVFVLSVGLRERESARVPYHTVPRQRRVTRFAHVPVRFFRTYLQMKQQYRGTSMYKPDAPRCRSNAQLA